MTTMLAIDASTKAVGWAVFEDGEYLKSDVFKPEGKDAWERIDKYAEWFAYWFLPPAYPITTVAYELATGNRGNMRTNRLLGALEYITRSDTTSIGVNLVTVTASQVRASGCHKHALAVASAIAGKEITSGDEADAIGVGLAALAKMARDALAAVGACGTWV